MHRFKDNTLTYHVQRAYNSGPFCSKCGRWESGIRPRRELLETLCKTNVSATPRVGRKIPSSAKSRNYAKKLLEPYKTKPFAIPIVRLPPLTPPAPAADRRENLEVRTRKRCKTHGKPRFLVPPNELSPLRVRWEILSSAKSHN